MISPYYEEPGITIYHGDCRDILPQLEPVDLVLTDPPYGVGFQYADKYEDTRKSWGQLMFSAIEEIRQKAPVMMLTCGTSQLWLMPPADWVMCWAKPGSTRRSKLRGFSEWEPVLVYGKRTIYNDFKLLPDCINHSIDTQGFPCPKPLKLYHWLISVGSNENATVLDPFMGSGTTLRAAKDLGRKAIGIEIEEKYCEIAIQRLKQEVLALNGTQEKESDKD